MINLRSNYPVSFREAEIFKSFISKHPDNNLLLRADSPFLSREESWALTHFLKINADFLNNSSRMISCISGTSAIYALLTCLHNNIKRIGVEDFTYNGVLTTARRLKFYFLPISCDQEGIIPAALQEALNMGLKLFYLQPTIHNPTNRIMSSKRREIIAGILKDKDVLLIEDDAYRFLHPSPPPSFLELLPQQTIHICSLSKPFCHFIQSCFIIYPKNQLKGIEEILNVSGTGSSELMRSFSFYLFQNTDFQRLITEKQLSAVQLKERMADILLPLTYLTFPTSYHIWIKLPPVLNSLSFIKELEQQNILVTGSHEYSVLADTSYIRIALSAEKDLNKLKGAVETIKNLLVSCSS